MSVGEEDSKSSEVILESFFLKTARDFQATRCRENQSRGLCLQVKGQSYPVSIKNTPIPPMQPTRICRGKYPIKVPKRKAPRAANTIPDDGRVVNKGPAP